MKREELPRTHDEITRETVCHVERLIADGLCDETAASLGGVTPFVVRMVRLRIENEAAEAAAIKARAAAMVRFLPKAKQLHRRCRDGEAQAVIAELLAVCPELTRCDIWRLTRHHTMR